MLVAPLLAASCSSESDGAPTAGAKRVLVVGWDGGTWDMIEPLLEAGRLPNLARLIDRGTTAEIESTAVPSDASAWVAAFTGTLPGSNGVYSWFAAQPRSYEVKLNDATANKAQPVWSVLESKGKRSLVVGVPMTYPPQNLDGVMISGMPAPSDATFTHPPELTDLLRARGFVPDLGNYVEKRALTGEIVEQQESLKNDVVVSLLGSERWDFAMVVFRSLDVVSHHDFSGDVQGSVAALYHGLDATLGDMLRVAGPDTDVLVLSDHGFASYDHAFFPYAWLLEQGYAVRSDKPHKPIVTDGPLSQRAIADRRNLIKTLNLNRTKVLVEYGEGNYGALRVNVKGREPNGCVMPQDVSQLLRELEARLSKLTAPPYNTRLLSRAWNMRALYSGPAVATLPDFVFEIDPAIAVRAVPSDTVLASLTQPHVDHDRYGFMVASGPSIRRERTRASISIADIAPTVLELFRIEVPSTMDGIAWRAAVVAPMESEQVRRKRAEPERRRRPQAQPQRRRGS